LRDVRRTHHDAKGDALAVPLRGREGRRPVLVRIEAAATPAALMVIRNVRRSTMLPPAPSRGNDHKMKNVRRLTGFLLCACLTTASPASVLAQVATTIAGVATVQIGGLASPPAIDGVINEAEWAGAAVIDQPFIQFQPDYGQPSPFRTLIRVVQTESALYVAFEAFDPQMPQLAAAQTQRDGEVSEDDSVGVLLDTFADGRTAYLFQVNALSTQQDARIADNGRTVDERWDAAWRSRATRHDDRWTVELEIPFAILRYASEANADWGLNFMRTVPRRLEHALWSPPSESVYRVSAFGRLLGIEPPAPEDPWQFIPYVLASYEKGAGGDIEGGGDVRWRPSSRFGVDLTVNPDFALVEADVEIINLSRYELRVPEKRPFFLEGNELYQQRIEQFYSRRIGDIDLGAKSNGKLGATDFSAIVTSADLEHDGGSNTANFGILRLQHGLGRGSNVGLLLASRDFLGDNAGSAGLDTTWFFTETLGMTAQYLQVHGPESDGGAAWFVRPAWDTARSHFHVRYTNLDDGIRNDFNAVGFMRDDDRKEWDTNLSHEFWFENGPLENIQPEVNYNRYTGQDGVLRSWSLDAEVGFTFRSGWELDLFRLEEYELFEKEFRNDLTQVEVTWNPRDGRSISTFAASGVNFDSDLRLYGGSIRWPVGDKWRFMYELTRLDLDPDPNRDSTIIHVFETIYAFNPDMYAKLFVQTNSAIDKENVQVLWVWRFKPPFGSLQLAYQRGTSEQGQESSQDDTLFSKLSWVF
jgi:hypothetical protein